MASDQHTPPVDDNLGPHALAICTPILVIALLLYVIRIIPRTTPKIKLNFADYLVSAAVVSCDFLFFNSFAKKGKSLTFGTAMRNRYLWIFHRYDAVWVWTPDLLLNRQRNPKDQPVYIPDCARRTTSVGIGPNLHPGYAPPIWNFSSLESIALGSHSYTDGCSTWC